jgi:hypothetical protein
MCPGNAAIAGGGRSIIREARAGTGEYPPASLMTAVFARIE